MTTVNVDDRPVPVVGLGVKRNSEAVISVVLGDDVKEKHSRSRSASNRGEYAKLLGFIYAILLIIIGFLLSLTEAVTNKWLGTTANMAFQTYILIVGTLFLLFLQFYLLRLHVEDPLHVSPILTNTRQFASVFFDRFKSASQRSANKAAISRLAANTTRVGVARGEVGGNDEQNDVNDTRSSTRVVTFNISKRAQTQRTPETFDGHNRDSFSSVMSALGGREPRRHRSTGGASAMGDDEDITGADGTMFWMDLDKLGNLFSHQGSSFFLRIGALFFGLGHVIYASLEIENWIHPDECLVLQYRYGWVFILRLIFIVTQTFVLFKGTTVKITKHQAVALLGFMHLIATNLTMWLCTLMREVSEALHTFETGHHSSSVVMVTQYPNKQYSAGSDGPYGVVHLPVPAANFTHQAGSSCADSSLIKVSRYLFPFVLEYSLIALGAIAFILFNGIRTGQDMHGHKRVARGFKNLIRVFGDSIYIDMKTDEETGSNNVDAESRHHHHDASHHKSALEKSHSGLFIGVLMLAGILTCVVLFYFGIAVTDLNRSAQIYFIADIVLHGCLLVACCLALYFTRNLGYVAKPLSTDDGLLFLTMSGSLIFELSVIVAAASHLGNMNSQLVVLDLVASIIASVETIIQTILILHVMRLCPASASDVTDMPGRGTISFLIVGNITAWIQRTLQVKELESLGREDLYGSISSLLLVNINLPLLLFFRFHSSVSFADAWHVAYTPMYHDVMASSSKNSARKLVLPRAPSLAAFSFPPPRVQPKRESNNDGDSDRSADYSVVILPTRISSSAPGSPRGRRRSAVSVISAAVLGENYRLNPGDFPIHLADALKRGIVQTSSIVSGDMNFSASD